MMRGGEPAKKVSVLLDGVEELELVVTDAGDGITCDHADWADARLLGNAD
ncbi:MAG: NPCBM/NEW2 domain-containing protein [Armatimonadetes bacterium]|nr:NPCBM/NEW2 domain-containing protein [Armatimonadota bacterium]